MKEWLRSKLGFIGDSPTCQSILAGTYIIPDEVDIYTKNLLAALAKPTNLIDTLKVTVTMEEFVKR